MNQDGGQGEFHDAAKSLSRLVLHLEAAQTSHAALVAVVAQLPPMTVDELAVGLGVSLDCAASLVDGEDFEAFVAPRAAQPDTSQRPDWIMSWTGMQDRPDT